MVILLASALLHQNIRTDAHGLRYLGKNEVVMAPGMRITAKTSVGTLQIEATSALGRAYTWEGATRSLEMDPRPSRWYGSLGLAFPGPGDHWDIHNGITRAVVEEGQQRLHSIAEFKKFIRDHSYHPVVYRNDGLMVIWGKVLERRQLDVQVWQIVLNGRKPTSLPGANDRAIKVDYVTQKIPKVVAAVEHRDLAALKLAIRQGADINAKDRSGMTPILAAVREGDAAAVNVLLDAGASANSPGLEVDSVLVEAIYRGSIEIVRSLLAHGANPNSRATHGMIPGQTPLFDAIMDGDAPMVQLLLKSGADPNAEDANGDTPLSRCASYSKSGKVSEIMQMLLDNHATVDHRSALGMTPLIDATLFGNFAAVKLLVEHGANVNARADAGRRLMWQLAFSAGPQEKKSIQKLKDSGQIDTLHEDEGGVLDYAEKKEIHDYLVSKGARSFAADAKKRIDDLWKIMEAK